MVAVITLHVAIKAIGFKWPAFIALIAAFGYFVTNEPIKCSITFKRLIAIEDLELFNYLMVISIIIGQLAIGKLIIIILAVEKRLAMEFSLSKITKAIVFKPKVLGHYS